MSTSTPVPSIAVVMATLGRPQNLAELVPAVLSDEAVRHFVVVVDGPDPISVAVLTSLQLRFDRLAFTQIERSGHLRALDVGVGLTDADVVLLLDDDVVPTPGLAAAHARAHRDQHGLVLVGSMPVQLPEGRSDIGSLLYARDYLSHCERMESGEFEVLDNLWQGNVSIRRSDCLSVGLATCAFTASYHTDRDLGIRLADAGLTGRFDPSLVAAHRHRRSDWAFLHDARRRGAGLAKLHEVHESRLGPFDPAVFTADLPAPLAAAARFVGSRPMAPRVARGLLGLATLPGVGRWGSGRLGLAKLARRLMLLWGATNGEGETAHGAALAKTAETAEGTDSDAPEQCVGERQLADR
jgi:GT2 family glycosyltransferase